MDWLFFETAKDADDVASALQVFVDEVEQDAVQITGDISELFAISSWLRSFDEALRNPRLARQSSRVARDLDLVIPSIETTLDLVRQLLGETRLLGSAGLPDYDAVWDQICIEFERDGPPLSARLELYHRHLEAAFDLLQGRPPVEDITRLRSRVGRLLRVHDSLDDRMNRLALDAQADDYSPPTPRTPLRPRPGSSYFDDWDSIPMPHAPELPYPQSPTFSSASSHTMSSSQTHSTGYSSALTDLSAHWGTRIYDGRHSCTPFRIGGQATRCLGRDEPHAVNRLADDNFIKVLELPMEATDVLVRLYWRPADHRARILFLAKDAYGRRYRYCIPLTALKILRTESCLQLCRANQQDGQLDLWAVLKFTLYERMVLFYCVFVAMKRQDWIKSGPNLDDHFAPGEAEEFGGQIEDDGYLHAFRVFRDRDSGGVRFETTALRGPMNKVPIWTAFVTQYIGSRTWMRMLDSKTVQLRELHPYVFCDKYRPPRSADGRFQLRFTSSRDAENFTHIFHRIRTRP